MKKTKRKKRIIREKQKRLELLNKYRQIFEEAKKLGFKSAQEFILYKALKKEGIEVYHNKHILGEEVDFFIPPKTIIEIGFRDDNLVRKWDKFIERGYNFLYFANLEVDNKNILKHTVKKIKKKLFH